MLSPDANVIIVHGYPSGGPNPSFADKEITNLLKQTGDMLQINVLDHIIIGLDRYYSFSDNGVHLIIHPFY